MLEHVPCLGLMAFEQGKAVCAVIPPVVLLC